MHKVKGIAIAVEKPRLHGLDYLRGLSAFCIMLYHYSSWTWGTQEPSSFLGKIGVYGVSIFYILSGITLSYVYTSNTQLNIDTVILFFKKRFYRIFPLLWVATLASIAIAKIHFTLTDIFLNISGLFGILKWDANIATGAWSIGNELVFYMTFPAILFILKQNRNIIIFTTIFIVFTFVYFSFFILQKEVPLKHQWNNYTNPLNQLLFFLSGVLLGRFFQPSFISIKLILFSIVAGTSVLFILPVGEDAIALVTGANRIVLGLCCLLICFGFFGITDSNNLVLRLFSQLGHVSYSLYLLHPLVYAVIKALFSFASNRGIFIPLFNSPITMITLAVAASLLISYYSYRYFESFFIKMAHRESR